MALIRLFMDLIFLATSSFLWYENCSLILDVKFLLSQWEELSSLAEYLFANSLITILVNEFFIPWICLIIKINRLSLNY